MCIPHGDRTRDPLLYRLSFFNLHIVIVHINDICFQKRRQEQWKQATKVYYLYSKTFSKINEVKDFVLNGLESVKNSTLSNRQSCWSLL